MSLIAHIDLTAAELRAGDVIVDGYDADLYRWQTVRRVEPSADRSGGHRRVRIDFGPAGHAVWRADAPVTVERISGDA